MFKPKEFSLIGAVVATGVLSFSGVLIETAMNVTFPMLIEEFGLTTSLVQWVTTIYLLMIAIIIPVSSYLNRNFSSRCLFVTANVIFLVGVIINCFSTNYMLLLFGRLLQGIGTGIGLPLMFYIILTKAPADKLGMMMGIGTMTTSIAPAIGPTYGGLLAHYLGWRYLFVFLLPVIIAALFLGLASLPKEQKTKTKESLAWKALLALGITFSSFVLAISTEDYNSVIIFLLSGLGGFLLFLYFNSKHNLLALSILRKYSFSALLVSLLIYQSLLLGFSFVIPNYLQIYGGMSSSSAGFFMFPGALLGAVLAPFSGRLLDRIGPEKPIIGGLFIAFIGTGLFLVLLETHSVLLLLGAHILLMAGLGFSYSNLMTCSLNTLSADKTADGNAILNTLLQFIGAAVTALVAAIFTFYQSQNGFIIGTADGIQIVFGLFVTLLAVSIVIVWSALHKE